MSCDCFGQSTKTIKNTSVSCFVCRGELSGVPRLLKAGFEYLPCSPLVQPESKSDPLEPMTSPDQCIVAFIGDCVPNAMEWETDCKHPVYDNVDVIKQCVNWPADEEGNLLFTVDDIEMITQGHTCCIRFHELQDCVNAPEWFVAQNEGGK